MSTRNEGGAGRPEPVRFYTEDELDAIEERDPDLAYQLARAQALAERSRSTGGAGHDAEAHPMPDEAAVRAAVEDARSILNRDGGDIELVAVDGRTVRVRFKGACVGCPNAPLDLKNVVERVVVGAVPGVARIENTF